MLSLTDKDPFEIKGRYKYLYDQCPPNLCVRTGIETCDPLICQSDGLPISLWITDPGILYNILSYKDVIKILLISYLDNQFWGMFCLYLFSVFWLKRGSHCDEYDYVLTGICDVLLNYARRIMRA